jgi:hypothetical protein
MNIADVVLRYYLEISMAATVSAVGFMYRRVNINRTEAKVEATAIMDGMRDLLRDRILGLWRVCKIQTGLSIEDRDNLESMYKSYHNLKGNGNIEDVYQKDEGIPNYRLKKGASTGMWGNGRCVFFRGEAEREGFPPPLYQTIQGNKRIIYVVKMC